jgi:hypothetical protein
MTDYRSTLPIYEHVKPLDGEADLSRKQLAKYFNRIGRGVNCRLDVPVLVMSDIKWAAKTFSDLSAQLTKLAWEDERSDIWRIMAARSCMEMARSALHTSNQKEVATKEWRKNNIVKR